MIYKGCEKLSKIAENYQIMIHNHEVESSSLSPATKENRKVLLLFYDIDHVRKTSFSPCVVVSVFTLDSMRPAVRYLQINIPIHE